jgi:hypothetical protein
MLMKYSSFSNNALKLKHTSMSFSLKYHSTNLNIVDPVPLSKAFFFGVALKLKGNLFDVHEIINR